MDEQHLETIFNKLKEDQNSFSDGIWCFINDELMRSAHHYGSIKRARVDPVPDNEPPPPEDPIGDAQRQYDIDLIAVMKGDQDITFQDFKHICAVLNVSVVSALKLLVSLDEAKRERRNSNKSSHEWLDGIINEAAEEMAYRLWKKDQ